MVSHIESCYTNNNAYDNCETSEDVTASGLDYGSGQGQVEITNAAGDDYAIVAHSQSGTDFTITKTAGGPVVRTCSNAGQGACRDDGSGNGVW
jgi:hypothetical protein